MSAPALLPAELEAIRSIFRHHPEVTVVKLFGSRAKGTHQANSDIDLALWGNIDALAAEAIAAELDELPLPYHYDVKAFATIQLPALREHIERVGIPIFPAEQPSHTAA
jgi:predicted nucleotidyltransferase